MCSSDLTLYAASMGLALVYLGEHFVVDVVVGTAVAAYSWVATRTWIRRVAPVLIERYRNRSPVVKPANA